MKNVKWWDKEAWVALGQTALIGILLVVLAVLAAKASWWLNSVLSN